MTTMRVKPIPAMDLKELDDYMKVLWATYYNIPMCGEENLRDIGICLHLIGRCQARRKALRSVRD